MFNALQYHPFAVEAFFETSTVLTYAVPKAEIQRLLPPCLEADCFNDEWAFLAVAMVQTRQLRPKGFPAFLGRNFFLMGYRIFVRYTTSTGKRLRGLYILRSETNRKSIEFLGNFFTHYKYHTIDIDQKIRAGQLHLHSEKGNLAVTINTETKEAIALPQESPFPDWQAARRFAGPLPFTFTYLPQQQQVLIIEGVRENWTPRPVEVIDHRVGFVEQFGFSDIRLANAFILENIPYYWKKGKLDPWQP
jgi:hypothetical protein